MTEEQINMIKELLRKKMKTYQQIQEVYDPNIFKAVFLAGEKVWGLVNHLL